MSLPNRGDTTLGNNKKKTTGGVDASMITRMKREQVIVSNQRSEATSIFDKPMTRGFTDGPVMPFFRRSASLGFFRSL